MQEILKAVSMVGFPIVAFFYLAIRLEPIIRGNSDAIKGNTTQTTETNSLIRELKIMISALNNK